MNLAMYYDPVFFDADWALHHLVRKIVGAIYSGIVQIAAHFTKILDFVLIPKGVKVEGIWTGYTASATSLTVSVNITNVPNPYVVAFWGYNAAGATPTSGNTTLNGVTMTAIAGAVNTAPSMGVFGIIPGTLGAQTFSTSVLDNPRPIKIVVFLLSGVNQTTPYLDGKSATVSGTSLSNTSMSTSPYGLVLDGYAGLTGSQTAASGQTATQVNSMDCAGSTLPTGSSLVTSMSNSTSNSLRITGISLNPA